MMKAVAVVVVGLHLYRQLSFSSSASYNYLSRILWDRDIIQYLDSCVLHVRDIREDELTLACF